jgi:hypothetical protein
VRGAVASAHARVIAVLSPAPEQDQILLCAILRYEATGNSPGLVSPCEALATHPRRRPVPHDRAVRCHHRALALQPARMPIASLTMAEGEVRAIGAECCEGHMTAATYFGSLDTAANHRFVADFGRAYGDAHPTSMWSAGSYAQVKLFARALAGGAEAAVDGADRDDDHRRAGIAGWLAAAPVMRD